MADPRTIRTSPELQDVAEQIGGFIEYFGFKRVHGRIWTHLLLSPEPLDAGDLVHRLKISKALVSMSISDLLGFEVIQIAGKSARGTVTYIVNSDVIAVITNILRQRERRMLSRLSAAVTLLQQTHAAGKTEQVETTRLDFLTQLVETAESTLDGMLQYCDVSFQAWEQFDSVPGLKAAENDPSI